MIKAFNLLGVLALVLATGCVRPESAAPPPNAAITVKGHRLAVEVIYSDAAMIRGLSDRESLSMDSAMLFIFDTPDRYSFWMSGMRFPLDIIWLNNGTVVDIWANAPAPASGEPPDTHQPSQPADAVLEVNAGLAEAWGLQPRDRLDLPPKLDLIRVAR